MAAAHMITEEEYKAALAEEPNIEGLSRKVEKTMAVPPPEEASEPAVPGSDPAPEDRAPEPASSGDEPSPGGPAAGQDR